MTMRYSKTLVGALGLLLALTLAAVPATAATFIINNVDAPGVGFNDPTPKAPQGGNPGTTIGEQRLNTFQLAADLWGAVLDSNVDIVIQGTFQPLSCSPTSGVLGAAGTIQIFAFGAPPPPILPSTWYHSSLINKLLGFDLTPGPPDPGLLVPPFNDDIVAFFNGDIGVNPNCLTGLDWYYGFDNNAGPNEIDLLNVLMHEFAHGLGFANFINETNGNGPLGLPDIYSVFTEDLTTGKTWDIMTPAERVASAVNSGNVVWNGANVTAAAPVVLAPQPTVEAKGINGFSDEYLAQPASFGPGYKSNACDDAGGATPVQAQVVLVDDGVGTGTDGCEPIANNVHGKVALIDRGACTFTQKVGNAEAAGAKAVIVANNVPGGPAPMGGSSSTIGIASVGISLADGDAMKAELPKLHARFSCSETLLAGAAATGQVKLYAPGVVALGSSISHWDTSATPNLLMEPFINSDLKAGSDLDLTPFLFLDEGWTLLP